MSSRIFNLMDLPLGKGLVGIMLMPPSQHNTTFSFKLNFESNNYIVEYEALVLGLEIA